MIELPLTIVGIVLSASLALGAWAMKRTSNRLRDIELQVPSRAEVHDMVERDVEPLEVELRETRADVLETLKMVQELRVDIIDIKISLTKLEQKP